MSKEKMFFNNIIINNLKKAFTLAEILITLTIIGVVAALTIPSLITKINEKVMENQKKVFEAKLIKGLNLTKAAGDLNNTYSSTYDFLESGLSKHLKIAKICDTENIGSCVPYDKIKYLTDQNLEDSIKTSSVKNVKILDLKKSDGFNDVASFVMGDGTVVIASYNLNCIVDSGELDKEISSCFAGIYDLNGSRKPNKMGKDILGFNNARIYTGVLAILGGVKIISNAQSYDGVPTSEYCDTSNTDSRKWTVKPEYTKYGITKCCTQSGCTNSSGGDRWVGGMIACQEMGGNLPTEQQLADMANALYGGKKDGGLYSGSDPIETTIASAGKRGSVEPYPAPLAGYNSFWSRVEYSNNNAAYRMYGISDSRRTHGGSSFLRSGASTRVFCVLD